MPSKAGIVSRLEKLLVGLVQPGEESAGFDEVHSSAAVERGLQVEVTLIVKIHALNCTILLVLPQETSLVLMG